MVSRRMPQGLPSRSHLWLSYGYDMLWSWEKYGKVTMKPVDLLAVWPSPSPFAYQVCQQRNVRPKSRLWWPSEPQLSQNWGVPCLEHPQTIGDMTYLAKNYLTTWLCFFVGCSNFGHKEVRSFSAPKKCRRTALVSFLESIRDAPDSRSRARSWVLIDQGKPAIPMLKPSQSRESWRRLFTSASWETAREKGATCWGAIHSHPGHPGHYIRCVCTDVYG